MPKTIVISKGFVASTRPIPKYNGRSFPSGTMYEIAQKVREGKFPLGIEHDRKHQLKYTVHSVEVREVESGEVGVWVELEVDEEDRNKVESKTAFSVSLEEVFLHSDPTSTKPRLKISIDPAHFDEVTIQSVITDLEQYFSVEARYLYQLSDVTLIGAIINIAQNTAGNLFAIGIFAGIQRLFSKQKNGQASAIIVEKENTKVTLENIDPKLMKRAIDRLIPSERSYNKRIAHKQIASKSVSNRPKRKNRHR